MKKKKKGMQKELKETFKLNSSIIIELNTFIILITVIIIIVVVIRLYINESITKTFHEKKKKAR